MPDTLSYDWITTIQPPTTSTDRINIHIPDSPLGNYTNTAVRDMSEHGLLNQKIDELTEKVEYMREKLFVLEREIKTERAAREALEYEIESERAAREAWALLNMK